MKKRFTTTLLYVLLILALLSGCVTGKDQGSTSDKTETTDKIEDVGKAEKEPPSELSWLFYPGGTAWQEFDFGNNWLMDIIEERSNVKFTEVLVPPHADYTNKLSLLIASGDMLDIMYSAGSGIDAYGIDGALLATDSYIDNSPVISKIYDKVQREYIRAEDGKTYGIFGYPNYVDFNTKSGFFYRADMLEKIGFKTPTTLEGWVDAMRRVKQEFPDCIPYSTFQLTQYYEFMFSPFNILPSTIFVMFDEDTLTWTHSFGTENMDKAVSFGRMLFQEGLLDEEFMTHTKADYNNKVYGKNMFIVVKNRGGALLDFNYPENGVMGAKILPSYYPAAEGIDMKDGVVKHSGGIVGSRLLISSKTKDPDACIRVMETLLSDEIKDLYIYGREGHEYEVINGKKVPIQPANRESGWRTMYGMLHGFNRPERVENDEENKIDSSLEFTDEEKEEYKKQYKAAIKKFEDLVFTYKPRVSNYGGAIPLEDDIKIKMSSSGDYQKSIIAKAIMGVITMDEFREEAKKIAANDSDIIEAMDKVMQIANERFKIK
jgi:ABC-type glycerol-3-phosphate transport system substrate-binding protein